MRLTAALAAVLGLGVLLAGPARADGAAEAQFFNDLDQAQITYVTPERALMDAHRICHALDKDVPGNEILTVLMDNNPTMLEWQAGAFLGASIASFCPQHDDVGNS